MAVHVNRHYEVREIKLWMAYAAVHPFRYLFVRMWHSIWRKPAPMMMRHPADITRKVLAYTNSPDPAKMKKKKYFTAEKQFLDAVEEQYGTDVKDRMHGTLRDVYTELFLLDQ